MTILIGNDRLKGQYQTLGNSQPRRTLSIVLNLAIVIFSVTFLVLSAWNFQKFVNRRGDVHMIYLNPRQPLLYRTSDKFLSFGIDTSLLRDMNNLPISNKAFITLARHLAPAFVRIGGTSADCLYFDESPQENSEGVYSPVDGQDISNFTITAADFENLYNFATRSELRMIFDLNVLIRDANNSWNHANAWKIISYARQRNMNLDWQLGNEPNSFHHVFNITIPPEQLAKDYYQLRVLLNKANYNRSLLVGPEVNHVGDNKHAGELYAKAFLENDRNSVNYVTWHQYYLNGREAQVADFVNPETFKFLEEEIQSIKEILKLPEHDAPMWLSETSTAYGGGAPELSDRFVAGFLWLDKLGYSARAGLNAVTRQSFFGGNYAMVGPEITPNPDWWVSVMYKQFVSEKVLMLVSSNFDKIRLYAHCTPESKLISRVPAITIYGVNIDSIPIRLSLQGIYFILDENAKVFLYALTADNLQSSEIKLNGEVLKLRPGGNLPPFRPIILKPTEPITLPPHSMVFMVIHGAEIPACAA